mmetsp:Transcript_1299/g.3719  ORF Transcript_1299/g.3719 Transcript_1299/m.3719 type:complete len:407 (+) Transcript_1299:57-1277(+)
MMSRGALLAALLLLPHALLALRVDQQNGHVLSAFQSYMHSYGKTYSGTQEYRMRMELFHQRMGEVEAQNSKADRLWDAAINHLSDRTQAELKELTGWNGYGWGLPTPVKEAEKRRAKVANSAPLPAVWNWTKLEATRQIRNQLACGSCWALATAGLLQAHSEIHQPWHLSRTFSPQELLACVPNPLECGGKGGCRGASPGLALDWISKHGSTPAEVYPYVGVDSVCFKPDVTLASRSQASLQKEMDAIFQPGVKSVPTTSLARSFGMVAWERLPVNAYQPVLRAVYERGPVAVATDSTLWSTYGGGVFDSCSKDPVVQHSVLIIGFGESMGHVVHRMLKYWLIQNSWGKHWGEKGHMRVLRTEDEGSNCGIDTQPQLGSGCRGGPSQIKVCGSCGMLYEPIVPIFS